MTGYELKKYSTEESSINNAIIDRAVGLGGLTAVGAVQIINDSAGNLSVNFNDAGGNTTTIKQDEMLSLDNVFVSAIYLSNRSGAVINYRILMWGDS